MIRIKVTRGQQRQWTGDLVHYVYKGKGTSKVPKIPLGLRMAGSAALCNDLGHTVTCAAITLCSLYQRVFTVHIMCKWQLLNAGTYLRFVSKELLCECSRCSEELSVTMPWGVQKFQRCSWLKHVNKSVEHCKRSG